MNRLCFPKDCHTPGLNYVQTISKSFVLIVLIFLGFSACKKTAIVEPVVDGKLMTKVKTDDATIKELTYTGNGQIYELIEAYSYKKYSYNAQNQLTKLEQAISINPALCFMPTGSAIEAGADPRKAKPTQYSMFEYDNSGTLTKKSNYHLNSGTYTLFQYQTYEYTGKHITKINTYNPLGTIVQYNSYEYDGNGNITRDDYYLVESGTNARILYSRLFEFDDKNNPFQVFANEGIPGLYTNKNNITKDTYIYYNAGTETRYTTEYAYEYNALGYPVKANKNSYIYGE